MAKIESISKFGFVADGKKYRYNEVTIDRSLIFPGNDVPLDGTSGPVATLAPVVDEERAKKFTPKYNPGPVKASETMSKAEWASKDQRISRQGVIQVAVQVTADWDKAVELANKMLEFVNQ